MLSVVMVCVLLRFAALLLARTFAREGLLGPAFVSGLQIKGVFLDVLDDVFLLNLPFETAQGALNGFAFLNLYFCQAATPPSPGDFWVLWQQFGARANTVG